MTRCLRGSSGRVSRLLVLGAAWAVVSVAVLGCGGMASGDAAPVASGGEEAGVASPIALVFRQVASEVQPMPVYGWTSLPPGARLADAWWPVLEYESRSDYQGETGVNPYVTGVGSAYPQVQVVLQVGDGWVVLLEDFRGDLGDVQGNLVGEVAGHAANLYDAGSGALVQWSDTGKWYGVFGRGVAKDELVALALAAQIVSPGE
jgi:hypothetical protein